MSQRIVEEPPPIELRSFQQFLMVAELLHYGQAAKRLGMTQPPLTQAIQKLELRLGVRLFERNRRNVKLSAAGLALVDPIRSLLATAQSIPLLAQHAALGHEGTLRIGFVSTVGFGKLPDWLRGFRRERPRVTIELREATANVQLSAFAERKLDVGFMLHAQGDHFPRSPELNRISVGVERLVLALPKFTSPSVQSLTAAQILSQPLIIFPRESAASLHDSILAFYHRNGVSPRIAQEAIQMQTIINLVSAGLGIAFVPQSIATLRRSGVIYRQLPRSLLSAAPRFETSLVWQDDANPVVRSFVAHVKQHLPTSIRLAHTCSTTAPQRLPQHR